MAKSALNRDVKSAWPVAKSSKEKSGTGARATKPEAKSDAEEKSPKAGTGRDTKEKPPSAKRGACLTFPLVEIVAKAHIEATQANPHLGAIVFSRMGKIVTAFD